MHEALCRSSGTTLDSVHAEDGPPITQRTSGLRSAFPRHAQAVEEYRFYVRPTHCDAYEAAWRAYYEVGGSVRFFDYMMGDDPSGVFESRVRAILRFAEMN
jgi:hypothetical protein